MGKAGLFGIAAVVSAAAALVVAAVAVGAADNRQVQVLDACDPTTFDAVLGEGACARSGGVTFEAFVAQLLAQGRAPAWRFAPERLKLAAGGTIDAVNRGGEFHTFTEVAQFGGGCVDELNGLLGLAPVPECDVPGIFGTTGLAPGDTLAAGPLGPGVHRFLCLIHPWMRTTVTVG
jgi:plastocyanin